MNIYLISAPSYHLINDEIKKIVKDKNYISFNLNSVSIDDLLKEASYFGLGEDEKIIVVRNASIFTSSKSSEADTDKLMKYLNNPPMGTTIIFTTLNPIDSRKKCTKIIKDKYHLINILPFKWKDNERAIIKYCEENKYSIENEAINYLINNTNNLDSIYQELDKIFLYYNKPTKILYKDIKNIVGSIIDNNNFHFVDAVIAKDLNTSLRLLQNLKVYKVEPLSLIILLAREYRLMYYLKQYQKNHLATSAICKELNLQDWQVNKLYTSSVAYTENELLDNLRKLADLDLGIKTGQFDKDAALMSFLVTVCI